jgi:lipid-A-disaccharide synthase
MEKPVIFVSTCEFSGDMHGEVLIGEIRKKLPGAVFYGIGGTKMASAGMELFYDSVSKSTIGFVEALKNLNKMKRLLAEVTLEWEKRRPDLMIWLDSGGFNLALAKEAKQRGIPVVCMFSPSAWAYGQDRAVKLAERVKLLLAVLPFEADFYRKFGTNLIYTGHPLIDRVKNDREPAAYRGDLGITPGQKLVVLMPGSRRQEIERLLPPMLEAAVNLDRELKIQWFLPLAASIDRDWLDSFIKEYSVSVNVITSDVYNLLAAADGAIISSGTATLEAAILNTPMIIIYRISKLSYMIYKSLETAEHKANFMVGLPNFVMKRKIVPELLQEDLTPTKIAEQLRLILNDPQYNQQMRQQLKQVKELIGPPGVMERAAGLIVELFQ